MKKILSCMLALLLMFQCGTIAFAAENIEESTYMLKETLIGEDALNAITNSEVNSHFTEIKENDELTVVAATVQTVYVMETIGENGVITESHLMNVSEVKEYEKKIFCSNTLSTTGNTWVGNDNETYRGGKFSLYLVVYKDSSGNYLAYATADWDNNLSQNASGIDAPADGSDYIAITWGGNGELKNTERSISGQYRDGYGDIDFSRAQSDSYAGYCWQFDERKDNHLANYIDCYAKITKTYTTKRNKETNVKAIYIHTYQKGVGSVTITAGTSGFAGGVTLSNVADQWTVAVDVPGIVY